MSTGFLFVTAPDADYKAVNLLLHELSNWGYNDGESEFRLITTKNAFDFELPPGTHTLEPTTPSLDSTFNNAWAGSTFTDVEDFCLDVLYHGRDAGIEGPSLFVVVDAAGFEAREGILAERAIDEEDAVDEGDEDFKEIDSFIKMRVPWNEVYSAWCNLSIANISFDGEMGERKEDDDDEEGDEKGSDGWFDYNILGGDLSEKSAKRKEKAFKKLKKEGRV